MAGNHADWTAVSTGGYHVCGRRSNARLYCWGDDLDGAVGDGGAGVDRASPVLVAGGFVNWVSVSAGLTHTCARRGNGRLYCWGSDGYGQAGTGANDGIDNPTPTLVVGGATDWSTATIGNLHVCGRRANNRIYCWGYGFFGQRGDGQSGSSAGQPTPTEIS